MMPSNQPVGTPELAGPDGLIAAQAARPGLPGEPAGAEVVRLRLHVAYDGRDFCGWARQPSLRSVQGELERALAASLRVPAAFPVRVAVAGRTDAGVHARGQVCHADVPAACLAAGAWPGGTWPDALGRRLGALLPADVRVSAVDLAPAGFDARWSAMWRRYCYRLADPLTGFDPLTRGFTVWHRRPLDVEAMSDAAAPFLGEHDFAAFCKARPEASAVRTVLSLDWQRGPGEVCMHITADAFCHSMVRALVGAFLAVGEGRWPVLRPAELLVGGERVPGAAVAPAHGLCLEAVGYPTDDRMAAQALRAKRWRGATDG